MRQAEALAAEKIAEAEAFSEEQAAQIEALETQIEAIQKDRDEQLSDWIKEMEKAHNERHSESIKLATCEQKLIEAEKRFDYVNAALIEQQKTNQELTAENIALKTRLEADLQKLEKAEVQEAENKKAEIKIEVQRNQIDQLVLDLKNQKELTDKEAYDNKALREKAAKLEGELIAWKEIKPEAKKATSAKSEKKPITKNPKAAEFKQTEWPE